MMPDPQNSEGTKGLKLSIPAAPKPETPNPKPLILNLNPRAMVSGLKPCAVRTQEGEGRERG